MGGAVTLFLRAGRGAVQFPGAGVADATAGATA